MWLHKYLERPQNNTVEESAADMAHVQQQADLKHRFLQGDNQPAFEIRVNESLDKEISLL